MEASVLGETGLFPTLFDREKIALWCMLLVIIGFLPPVTAWAAGSYLTVNVVTASSATDLTLTVQYTEA